VLYNPQGFDFCAIGAVADLGVLEREPLKGSGHGSEVHRPGAKACSGRGSPRS